VKLRKAGPDQRINPEDQHQPASVSCWVLPTTPPPINYIYLPGPRPMREYDAADSWPGSIALLSGKGFPAAAPPDGGLPGPEKAKLGIIRSAVSAAKPHAAHGSTGPNMLPEGGEEPSVWRSWDYGRLVAMRGARTTVPVEPSSAFPPAVDPQGVKEVDQVLGNGDMHLISRCRKGFLYLLAVGGSVFRHVLS